MATYLFKQIFKISTLVYRSLAGTTPVYLADECTLVTAAGRHPQQSVDNWMCLVKRSHNQLGDHCFATTGPTLWNSLPEQLWQPDITQTIQTIVENIYVRLVGLRCLVSEHWGRLLEIFLLTYLLTYLLILSPTEYHQNTSMHRNKTFSTLSGDRPWF